MCLALARVHAPHPHPLGQGGSEEAAMTSLPSPASARPGLTPAAFGHPAQRKWGRDGAGPALALTLLSRLAHLPRRVASVWRKWAVFTAAGACLQFPSALPEATRGCNDEELPLGGRTRPCLFSVGAELVAGDQTLPSQPLLWGVCVFKGCSVSRTEGQRQRLGKTNIEIAKFTKQ